MVKNAAFGQILALAPMVLPSLGIPKEKINLILATLQAPDIMVDDQPNIVKLLELKTALDAIQIDPPVGRLVCAHCTKLNKF